MNQPKRHHYLPVCYLSGFLGPSGRLAIFDRSKGEFRSQTPQNAGYEKFLYSFTKKDGTRGQTMEEMFCRFETHFPGIRQRLEAGNLLTHEELDPIFAFTAAQIFRGPRMLTDMTEIGSNAIDRELEKALATEESAQLFMEENFDEDVEFHRLSLEEIRTVIKDFDAQHPRKNSLLRVLPEIIATAYNQLRAKPALTVCHSPPGKAFLTSDRPVLIHKAISNALGVEGLLGEGSSVFMPLSKSIGLNFQEGPSSLVHSELLRDDLFLINSSIAKSSVRLLLSDSDQRLNSFVKKLKISASPPFRGVSPGGRP